MEVDVEADPRFTDSGILRWCHGPYTERVKKKTKRIIAQIKRCDEEPDEEGFCACGRYILQELQRAYDTPAPEYGAPSGRDEDG